MEINEIQNKKFKATVEVLVKHVSIGPRVQMALKNSTDEVDLSAEIQAEIMDEIKALESINQRLQRITNVVLSE
jgi:hypothetical protein